MVYHKGDDLEDDFMPDETVALSEDEGFGSIVGDQDDVGTLLSADEEEKAEVKSAGEQRTSEKKRKRREKEKERKEKECAPPASLATFVFKFLTRDFLQQKRKLNETTESGDLTSVSPGVISEYLSIMQAKSFSKSSALELQDRHIPGTCTLASLSEDFS
jgi:protein CMS1